MLTALKFDVGELQPENYPTDSSNVLVILLMDQASSIMLGHDLGSRHMYLHPNILTPCRDLHVFIREWGFT